MGSFRPIVGSCIFTGNTISTESLVETALKSLRHSCRSGNLPDKEFSLP